MLAQNKNSPENARINPVINAAELKAALTAHSEWLVSDQTAAFAVQTDETEVSTSGDKVFFGCLTARGWQTWRVVEFQKADEKLFITTARKLLQPSQTLELTARVSIEDLRRDINAARIFEASALAEIARRELSKHAKIKRVSLNQSNRKGKAGTIARILLELPNHKTILVCSSVVEKSPLEKLLSHTILWFSKLQERCKIIEIWIVVEEKSCEDLQKLHALLRDGWKQQIKIYAKSAANKTAAEISQIENQSLLRFIEPLSITELFVEKPKKQARQRSAEISQTAVKIVAIAPDEIDVVRAKHGETLRFNGLPFARIREILGAERIWFGTEGKSKKELTAETLQEFAELTDNLREHRRADALDKRHALYKSWAESWLESVLRRDVSRLDPNLILAPLYAQFRVSHKTGALDLLALRTDGRLVVVELKTSADREQVFQAANYWRQIEQMRRHGQIERAKLFGDLKILDLPPLVYLVAPLMSFHHDFEVLAKTISPAIELWRFDLNEDWRRGINVARRERADAKC